MAFLPIVQRELQSRSRRAATHWSRWAIAVLGGLICFQIFSFETRYRSGMNTGQVAYGSLAVMAFLLAGAAGLLAADAVSSERREGTLGLLFLTDLKGYDVIFGKLVATGLTGFYAMLGFAPALALPLIAGGVTGGELFRTTLAVMNVLWVALAVGLWVSTRSEMQFKAMRGALVVLFLVMVVPWTFSVAALPLTRNFSPAMASPHYAFYASSAARYPANPPSFWWSLALTHLEGWVFLALASRFIGKNWREGSRAQASKSDLTFAAARHLRRRLEKYSPVYYAACQMRGQTAIFWFAMILKLSGYYWIALIFRIMGPSSIGGTGWVYSYQGVNLVMNFASAALLAWAGARFFLNARRTGEFELLMSTPLGAQDMVSGQWAALWHRLRWPFGLFLLANLIPMSSIYFNQLRSGTHFPVSYWLIQVVFGTANSVMGIIAICRVALWFGFRARNTFSAIAWTIGLLQGLPWLLGMLANLLLAFGGQQLGGGGGLSIFIMSMYVATPIITLSVNIISILWANRNLRRELRLPP